MVFTRSQGKRGVEEVLNNNKYKEYSVILSGLYYRATLKLNMKEILITETRSQTKVKDLRESIIKKKREGD